MKSTNALNAFGRTIVSAFKSRTYCGGSSDCSAGRRITLLPPVKPRFGLIAVSVEPLVQRRTGRHDPDTQHQHKNKRRRDCCGSPAKTQTDPVSPQDARDRTQTQVCLQRKPEKACDSIGRIDTAPAVTGEGSEHGHLVRFGCPVFTGARKWLTGA